MPKFRTQKEIKKRPDIQGRFFILYYLKILT